MHSVRFQIWAEHCTPELTKVNIHGRMPLEIHWKLPVEIHWISDNPLENAIEHVKVHWILYSGVDF